MCSLAFSWEQFRKKSSNSNMFQYVFIMFDYLFRLISMPIQYIPRNMHTVFALLCFVMVIHWLNFPYPSGLLHWHCGNLTIAPVPAKQPWWIWINASCEFIMNDCITTTKQSTTKPCAYFLGYTVHPSQYLLVNGASCLHNQIGCLSIYLSSPGASQINLTRETPLWASGKYNE